MAKPTWKSTYPGDWVVTEDSDGKEILWVWTGEDWVNNSVVWKVQDA